MLVDVVLAWDFRFPTKLIDRFVLPNHVTHITLQISISPNSVIIFKTLPPDFSSTLYILSSILLLGLFQLSLQESRCSHDEKIIITGLFRLFGGSE